MMISTTDQDVWKTVAEQLGVAQRWADSVGGIDEARAWLDLLEEMNEPESRS